jgi:hypothetical protein
MLCDTFTVAAMSSDRLLVVGAIKDDQEVDQAVEADSRGRGVADSHVR